MSLQEIPLDVLAIQVVCQLDAADALSLALVSTYLKRAVGVAKTSPLCDEYRKIQMATIFDDPPSIPNEDCLSLVAMVNQLPSLDQCPIAFGVFGEAQPTEGTFYHFESNKFKKGEPLPSRFNPLPISSGIIEDA